MIPVLILAAVVLTGASVGYWFSAPGYQGPDSDHFDGRRFRNREAFNRPNILKAMAHFATTRLPKWPDWVENQEFPAPPQRVGRGRLRVTFINHATVLLQVDSLNILTDPIWAQRCSPVSFAGPQRHRAAGLAIENLPPIDVILISHNHYDHLDLASLRQISARDHPRVFTGLGNGALLSSAGIAAVTELDWEQSAVINDRCTIHAQPARHFSSRGLFDGDATLWLSFVIESSAGNIYFAGDTGYGLHFTQTAERFAPFRLALLPIGAYLPRWIMGDIHLSPPEALQAHQDLRAQQSLAIHFGTFQLAVEEIDQPVKELRQALREQGVPEEQFWVLENGESREVSPW